MVINRRKKNTRMRGAKTTHGYGSKKKNRGSGNKGGKGMAGSGKRADQKKPTILNIYGPDYFGRKGFRRPQKVFKKLKTINLSDLDRKIELFLQKKLVAKEGNFYIVDLAKLGYDKILGSGFVNNKYKIKTNFISKNALKKIQDKGGEVINGSDKQSD